MGKNYSNLAVIALLSSILTSNQASANQEKFGVDQQESIELVTSLIQSGHIKINAETGEITLESSVLEVLQKSGVVQKVTPSEMANAGTSTTGGGC